MNKNIGYSYLFLLIAPLLLITSAHLFQVVFPIHSNYNATSYIFISILDVFLSVFALFLILISSGKNNNNRLIEIFVKRLKNKSATLFSITTALFIILLPSIIASSAQVLSGCGRDCLVMSADGVSGILYFLFVGMATLLVSYFFVFHVDYKKTILLFVFLVSSLIITASRAELVFTILFTLWAYFLTLSMTGSIKAIPIRKISGSLVLILVFFAALFQYYIQRRGAEINLLRTIFEFFSYRASSLHLGAYLIESQQVNFFHAIFVYPFDYLVGVFWDPNQRLMTTEFYHNFPLLGEDHLGLDYRSNVVYPWWSWFYASMGPVGIIIKFMFIYSLLYVFFKLRLLYFFIYFSYSFLIGAQTGHPMASIVGPITITILIFMEITSRLCFKK